MTRCLFFPLLMTVLLVVVTGKKQHSNKECNGFIYLFFSFRLKLNALIGICFLAFMSSMPVFAQQDRTFQSIKTIDPAYTDFSDLNALKKAIGSNRVVVLAEQDHGDGSTLLAKTRLVKFLHQQMGFNVIAFEADFYTTEGLAKQNPGSFDKQFRGQLFPFWSATKEMDPFWRYIDSVNKKGKKIHLAGFDTQLNTDYARQHFSADVRKLMGRMSIGFDTISFYNILDTLLHGRNPAGISKEQQQFFFSCLDTMKKQQSKTSSPSLIEMIQFKAQQSFYRRYRERNMAVNLAHVVSQKYPNKKVIVWTASYHGIKDMEALWQYSVANEGRYSNAADKDSIEAMAQILQRKHHVPSYVLNMVSLSGSYTPTAWTGITNPPAAVSVSKGGVEDNIVQYAADYGFVNLRTLPPDHWLRQPIEMIPYLHHRNFKAVWPKVFDGLFFIKNMQPLTPIQVDRQNAQQ